MKGTLNWQTPEVVNIFDEASLWAAPFGRILLENIPMKPQSKVLDLGFGTGFPLVELSQRFGSSSKIYGMDIWEEAIMRAKEKISVLGLQNIEIFEQSAEQIPLPNNEIDLICSNLGVNNFDQKEKIFRECNRVLKTGGYLCISTNPKGTFKELFDLFEKILQQLNLSETLNAFQIYIDHRDTQSSLQNYISKFGFTLSKALTDKTKIRFVDAAALLDHGLIRIGFLEYWEKLIPKEHHTQFFETLIQLVDRQIKRYGIFEMTIPILYLEFRKV